MKSVKILVLSILAIPLVACAGASVRSTEVGRPVKPPVVLVFEFAIDPQDVVVNTLGPQFATPEADDDKKRKEARKISAALAKKTVAALRAKRIPAEIGRIGGDAPMHAFMLRGQFVTVQGGSTAERMLVGFGAGKQQIRANAQVYQITDHGLQQIVRGVVEAHGDSMPGMAVPVGVGAAAGKVATAAVISGGMNVVQELSGGIDVALDNMAKEIGRRASNFWASNGWY